MKRHSIILASLLLSFIFKAGAVLPVTNPVDTLFLKDYSYLSECIDKYEADARAHKYLKAYLAKAKAEKNWKEIVEGYKNYLHASDEGDRLIYADSMITAAYKSRDKDLIGSAYLTRGIVYYSLKQYPPALNNYLLADKYISKGNDDYLKYKTKYNIAHIKYYLGFYKEALPLFQQCVTFFKDDNSTAYISTLHSIGLCYSRMGFLNRCSAINALAIKECKRLEDYEMLPYIGLSEGVNLYLLKKYDRSLTHITQSLQEIINNKDFANEAVAYFYIGKNHLAKGYAAKAIPYFRKVDLIFAQKGYLRPDLRENYEILIQYSRKESNLEAELHYINQLLKADSLLNNNYKYLSQKIHKEYDTAKLIDAKASVEKQLRSRKNYEKLFVSFIVIFVLFLLLLVYKYFKGRQNYKLKFEELMNQKREMPGTIVRENQSQDSDTIIIKPEVAEAILKHLDKFEKQHKYLQKDITAVKLAEAFNTNNKYLSKVILSNKGKKFTTYLNDLRIDYIVNLLITESKYRNYTNKALAEEAGFSTTQNFTNAFLKRTQISPTFFIEELKKKVVSNSI